MNTLEDQLTPVQAVALLKKQKIKVTYQEAVAIIQFLTLLAEIELSEGPNCIFRGIPYHHSDAMLTTDSDAKLTSIPEVILPSFPLDTLPLIPEQSLPL